MENLSPWCGRLHQSTPLWHTGNYLYLGFQNRPANNLKNIQNCLSWICLVKKPLDSRTCLYERIERISVTIGGRWLKQQTCAVIGTKAWANICKLNPDGQNPKFIATVSHRQVAHERTLNGQPATKQNRKRNKLSRNIVHSSDSKVHNEQLNTETLIIDMKTLKCGKATGLHGVSNE